VAPTRTHREALSNGHKNGFSSGALEELEPFFYVERERKKHDFYRLSLHFPNTLFKRNIKKYFAKRIVKRLWPGQRSQIARGTRNETIFRVTKALPNEDYVYIYIYRIS
jgi:hypothetical protein